MQFSNYWRAINGETFKKADLSVTELKKVQETIARLQKKGLPAYKIINSLQRSVKELSVPYKAKRAFWTELKRMDTEKVLDAGDELDIDKYRVILSPNACKICREKTESGKKIFTSAEVNKSGDGQFVPWHPNCFCIAVPVV